MNSTQKMFMWRPLPSWEKENFATKPKKRLAQWALFWSVSQVTWLIFLSWSAAIIVALPISLVSKPILCSIQTMLIVSVSAFVISGTSILVAHIIRTLHGEHQPT